MIILGLGSNISDRLYHLRCALHAIRQLAEIRVLAVSPLYASDALVPANAPAEWRSLPFLNMAIGIETTLMPEDLFKKIKHIEQRVGREVSVHWAPRIIDIDILAWEGRCYHCDTLTIPHPGLSDRPFALWPLLDITPEWIHPIWNIPAKEKAAAWGSRFTQQAPFHTHQTTPHPGHTKLVGIINVTPDSFSDGGLAHSVEKALARAGELLEAGAKVLDIGAESTGPGANAISVEEEAGRLFPVLTALRQAHPTVMLSVDTRHSHIATRAIELGVQWVNDVSGFHDPAMVQAVAASHVDIVVMHSLSIPEDRQVSIPQDIDPVSTVFSFAEKRIAALEAAGIDRQRIIFDVGIGFGKTAEQSLFLIQHIDRFHALGVRLLVGHSRKSFFSLATTCHRSERDIETCVTSCYLARKHVHYLRVHNVDINRRALVVEGLFANSA